MPVHSRPSLDWIGAAALRGTTAVGPLHSLRAGHESSLQSARDDIERKRSVVEQLGASLDVGADQVGGADSINVNNRATQVQFSALPRVLWFANAVELQ